MGFKNLGFLTTFYVDTTWSILFFIVDKEQVVYYFAIRGGSRKKIAKKMIPSVPTSKNV